MAQWITLDPQRLEAVQQGDPRMVSYNVEMTLFHAAQETTGIRLSAAFPYEDACGCFEFLDGFELLRYLKASEFGAVD